MEIRPSFCRVCVNGCPILVEVDDGRAVRVTGDPDGPLHRGYSCHRGRALPELTYSPKRLLHSHKRGDDGSYRPIGSEQAIDEVAERLREIVERHGPRSVALYAGTQAKQSVPAYGMADSLMDAIGSPMRFSSNSIDQPGKHIAKGLHGYWQAPAQGFDEPDVILWVGINPFVTYLGIPLGNPSTYFKDLARRGARTIVVDPRRNDLARRASLFIQPRPGEDVAIIAGMIRIILEEGLYDREFVDAHVTGLDALRATVQPFTPDYVAARADIPVEQLVEAARTFGSAKRGYAVGSVGPNMGTGQGTLFEYLILALDTLCGHYLRAGERVRTPGTLAPPRTFKAQAAPPIEAFGFGEPLRVRGLADTLGGMQTAVLPEEILTPGEGQVRALFVLGGNPVAAWPDQLLTIRAMRALDLLVTVDVEMSQTAKLAHYVIAPAVELEMPAYRSDGPSVYANGYDGYSDATAQYAPAVVERPPGSDVIDDWELFYGLGTRLGYQLHVNKVMKFRNGPPTAAKGAPVDMTRKPTSDELLEMMIVNPRVPLAEVKRHPHGALFPPDPPVVVQPPDPGWQGRLDLGNALMMADLETTFHAVDAAGQDGYEFRLIGRRMHQYNSTIHTPAVDRGRPYNPAFMHPDDLARLGLGDGDLAEITSSVATIRAVVATDPTVRCGVVSMAHCFGGPPEEDDEVRRIGSPTGRLLSVDRVYDRYSGQPLMSNIPVNVLPVA